MSFFDHIVSYTVSAVVHVAGILLIGLYTVRYMAEIQTREPEPEVVSIVWSLPPPEKALPGTARAEPQATAPDVPTLQLPAPVEPIPQETPKKTDLTDALPALPEAVPVPEPVPTVAIPEPPELDPLPEPDLPAAAPAPARQPTLVTSDASALPNQTGGDKPAYSAPSAALLGPGSGASGQITAHPSLARPIRPNYPMGARRRGEEGTVILDVEVGAKGNAESVKLVTSSGFPDIDRAAESAASQARFKPGQRDGAAISSTARLTIIFRLRDQ